MRFGEVTIANFRGFRREVTIDVNGDVVVVWGPNGSGKTSLLDALQWLLLGDVPRLRAATLRKDEDYISNRYADGAPYVRVSLDTPEGMVIASRRGLRGEMETLIQLADGRELLGSDADDWLLRVAGGHAGDAADTGDAWFTRRYMLQQDDITEFLRSDTRERYTFLAELTGLERLQTLDAQLKSELRALRESVKDQASERTNLAERVRALETERTQSAAILERQQRGAEIRIREAAERLQVALGTEPTANPEDALVQQGQARVRDLRGMLGTLADQRIRIEALKQRVDALQGDLPARLAASTKRLAAAEELRTQREADVHSAESELLRIQTEHDRAQQLAALAIEQLGDHCPVCAQEYDHLATVARLEHLLADDQGPREARERLETAQRALLEAKQSVDTLTAEHAATVHAAEEAAQTRALFANAQADADRLAERLRTAVGGSADLAPSAVESQASALASEIETRTTELEGALSAMRQATSLRGRIDAIERDVVERRVHLESHIQDVEALERRADRASAASRWLGREITRVMEEVVQESTGLINAFYTRLDVHPTSAGLGSAQTVATKLATFDRGSSTMYVGSTATLSKY